MEHLKKKSVAFAVISIVIGIVLVFTALMAVDFNISKLDSRQLENKIHFVTEDFERIRIEGIEGDVRFMYSEDGECRVETMESEKFFYNVNVVDEELRIIAENNEKWYDNIVNIEFGKVITTIWLPKDEYETLTVKNKSEWLKIKGDIEFKEINLSSNSGDIQLSSMLDANDITIKTHSGEVSVGQSNASHIQVHSNSGDVRLSDVIAKDEMAIETNSGEVTLRNSDTDTLSVKTNSGDVECSLLTEKVFTTHTNSGDIHVPDSSDGGVCEIRTNSGDIKVKIKK